MHSTTITCTKRIQCIATSGQCQVNLGFHNNGSICWHVFQQHILLDPLKETNFLYNPSTIIIMEWFWGMCLPTKLGHAFLGGTMDKHAPLWEALILGRWQEGGSFCPRQDMETLYRLAELVSSCDDPVSSGLALCDKAPLAQLQRRRQRGCENKRPMGTVRWVICIQNLLVTYDISMCCWSIIWIFTSVLLIYNMKFSGAHLVVWNFPSCVAVQVQT